MSQNMASIVTTQLHQGFYSNKANSPETEMQSLGYRLLTRNQSDGLTLALGDQLGISQSQLMTGVEHGALT